MKKFLIRQMSSKLGSLESFRFGATVGFDEVPVSEAKVKYTGSMKVSLQRPGQLRVRYQDELLAHELQHVLILLEGDITHGTAEEEQAAISFEERVRSELDAWAPIRSSSLLSRLQRSRPAR